MQIKIYSCFHWSTSQHTYKGCKRTNYSKIVHCIYVSRYYYCMARIASIIHTYYNWLHMSTSCNFKLSLNSFNVRTMEIINRIPYNWPLLWQMQCNLIKLKQSNKCIHCNIKTEAIILTLLVQKHKRTHVGLKSYEIALRVSQIRYHITRGFIYIHTYVQQIPTKIPKNPKPDNLKKVLVTTLS